MKILFSVKCSSGGAESTGLKFWGDKNQREVDLVMDNPPHLMTLEIKYKERIKDVDFSGIKAFERFMSAAQRKNDAA